ncbi:MAG TPA: ribosome-binding factor A [Candidatus Paceibacterota bacterium]|nr:ribosome-binding factor A [Candidatus Paceibacterota bacterium]
MQSGDRHEQVANLLKEFAAKYIAAEANTDPLITVTAAKISPDYRNATVFITTLPEGREPDALIFLKRHGRDMRRFIMKQTNLKIVPHLTFDLDVGERHRQHIDELVRETGVEPTFDIEE